MGRKKGDIPKLRLHKASGQAVATIGGRDYYLGKYGTEAARVAYDALIARWVRGGRAPLDGEEEGVSVSGLVTRYWEYAQVHYRKAGRPTSQIALVRVVCRALVAACGAEPAAAFGPRAFKAIRDRWVAEGLARSTVNDHAARLKRIFRWGVAEELVPPEVLVGLQAVPALQAGRSRARETEPVGPVPPEHLEAVLPHLPAKIHAMVRLMDLSGMRPGEACALKPCHLDRSGPVWAYTVPPEVYKSSHRGKGRVVLIGPKAQAVLAPWLAGCPDDDHVFKSPARGYGPHRGGGPYRTDSITEALHRACRKAGVPEYSANQLRHGNLTRIRAAYGIEMARIIAGHSDVKITEYYAERDLAAAAKVIEALG